MTKATDVNQESHEQQDEINVKSQSQLQKDESEKQERIDNMFMNLRSAETVCYKKIMIIMTVAIRSSYRSVSASWLIILSPLGRGLTELRTSGLGESSYELTTPTWNYMWHLCTMLTMINLIPTSTHWISRRKLSWIDSYAFGPWFEIKLLY